MLVDSAAGAFLAAGAVATAAAAVRGGATARRGAARGPRLALALALATAAYADGFEDSWWPPIAACGLAAVGILGLVLARSGPADRLSWLDATMGASSTAGLVVAARAGTAAAGGARGGAAGPPPGRGGPRWAGGGPARGVGGPGAGT